MIGSGAEPSGVNRLVQAGATRLQRTRQSAAVFAVLFLLVGCASAPDTINPVSWYHDIEGGPIAAKRQAVPGQSAPYPNLASVPQPPQFLPAPQRTSISAALLADRAHANQAAVLEPLPQGPSNGSASQPPNPAPGTAASPPSAAGAEDVPSAKLPAAAAPPSAPAPPEPVPPATLAAAAAALPTVPAAPPPPPSFAALPLPSAPPAPSGPATAESLTRLVFAHGSAQLSAAERARLSTIAADRRGADIAVIGYGDAATSDPAAQSAALRLGLARAAAVAAALAADGVPDSALRLGAEASGSGAALREVD